MDSEMVFHWVLGLLVAGLLVVAAPSIAHQAMSDEGDGWSGATPECPTWNYELRGTSYEVGNSLPPTYY